jgi:HPt (histidine-containing phosphotransfer) domain-containing protein
MNDAVDRQFFARLTTLNDQFASGVPALLGRLAAARAAFDPAAPGGAPVLELQALLHTMAGSAATFGFRVLGQQARALEQRLQVLMAFETVAPDDWNTWFAGLDEFVAWGRCNPRAAYYSEDVAQ